MAFSVNLLKDKNIDIDDLLLDPNNPRFSKHSDEMTPLEEAEKEEVQNLTIQRMKDKDNRFEIPELVNAIMEDGFIPVDKIFVRPVKKKYLVIEGNRRITAIKTILAQHKDKLSSDELKRLKNVPCVVVDVDQDGAQDMMRRILGLRHHGSILPWKPLPAALNLYNEYMIELCKGDTEKSKKNENFFYHPPTAKTVAAVFGVKLGDVRSKVRIYRLYLQLIEASGNELAIINKDAFSMLEETLGRDKLREFFGYNEETSTLCEEGAEKILDLYFGLADHPPVVTEASAGESNVRDFGFVVANGTEEDVRRIVQSREKAGEVSSTVRARIDKHVLQVALDIVLSELDKINLGDIGLDGFAPNETDKLSLIDKKIEQLKRAAGLS